jgi:hypothetical protein
MWTGAKIGVGSAQSRASETPRLFFKFAFVIGPQRQKAASMMASGLSSAIVKTRPPHRAGGGVKGERSEFIVDP